MPATILHLPFRGRDEPAEPPQGPAAPRRPLLGRARERLLWMALLGAGILLRALYLLQVATLPFFSPEVGGGGAVFQRALAIAAGRWRTGGPAFDGNAVGAWCAGAVLAWPGADSVAVCALQLAAGLVAVLVLARLARRLGGPLAGLATLGLGAFYGPLAFLDAGLPGGAWVVLGLAIALSAVVAWDARHRAGAMTWLAALSAGVGLAVAALERPQLVVLLPVALAWAAGRGAWRGAPAALIGFALPVALLATLEGAAPFALPASAGARLYIGNHEHATGALDEPWSHAPPAFGARPDFERVSRRAAEAAAGRALAPAEASALWASRADAWARAHPFGVLALAGRKLLRLASATETPSPVDYGFVRDRTWALAAMPIGFGVVLPLAAIGLVWAAGSGRRRAPAFLLAALAAAAALSVLPFFVTDRDRMALVPPLLVAAGLGVVALMRIAAAPHVHERRATRALAAGVACLVLARMPLAHAARADEWIAFAREWRARGDMVSAAAAYERALADVTDGRTSATLLAELAAARRALGDDDGTISALHDLVRLDPANAAAHGELGLLLLARGDHARARYELMIARRLGDDDPDAARALATLTASDAMGPLALPAALEARGDTPHPPAPLAVPAAPR